MKQIAEQVVRTAPEDNGFLARMFEQTTYVLAYKYASGTRSF
jgi:hypothetical protein